MRLSLFNFTSNITSSLFKTNQPVLPDEDKDIHFRRIENVERFDKHCEIDEQNPLSDQSTISEPLSQTFDSTVKSSETLSSETLNSETIDLDEFYEDVESRPTKRLKLSNNENDDEKMVIKSNRKVPREHEQKYSKTVSFVKLERIHQPIITKRKNGINFNRSSFKNSNTNQFQSSNMNFDQTFPFMMQNSNHSYTPFVTPFAWPFNPSVLTNPGKSNHLSSWYNLPFEPIHYTSSSSSNKRRQKRKLNFMKKEHQQEDQQQQKDVFTISSDIIFREIENYFEEAEPFQWNFLFPDCLLPKISKKLN